MMLEKHGSNTQGRDFIVGDIHGQYWLLMEAMLEVDFDRKRDRLFSVGDLIDRGSDSFKCLSLAFEPWFHGVRGNHEILARDALNEGAGNAWELWQMNGGSWVYLDNAHEVKTILNAALEHLPYARELEVGGKRVGIVHAEPPADWSLIERDGEGLQQQMVWGRSRISRMDDSLVDGIDAVVVGHTIVDRPASLGNVCYIDTGAFHTGTLTLIDAREVL